MQRVTTIVRLLFLSRPAAVFGRVRTIIVDSVEAMLRGRLTAHVGKEIGINIPTFADSYSTRPIAFVFREIRIMASLTHTAPRMPFYSLFFPDCISVFVRSLSQFGKFKTSARSRTMVPSQRATGDEKLCSAVAMAKPAFERIFTIGDNGQMAKTLTGEVNKG